MRNKGITKYNIEVMNKIDDNPKFHGFGIWARFGNELKSLWCRNYKDKIKVETLIEIPIKTNYGYEIDKENYQDNFRFDITPKQAREIINSLTKTLENRKKIGSIRHRTKNSKLN